jgi:crotonobetainyl-CoA:carnitine CoA-transferase CaiB-like acyl-CoA transferase
VTHHALTGVTVLDIGHGVTGPYACRLLADLGADVLKLEKPGFGDRVRRSSPTVHGGDRVAPTDEDRSVLFEALNWNKRSIELDLSDALQRPCLDELVGAADIVITSLRPQTLARWQLLPDDLLSVNPLLSVVAVTNFGLAGPKAHYEGSDLVFNAASGIMAISGDRDREPLKHGGNTSLFAAGLNAAYTALAGYWTARTTGDGVGVDLAIRDCLASELVMNNAFHALCGLTQGCPPSSSDPLDGNPVEAGKGYVSLQTSTRIPVSRFSELFDDRAFERADIQDSQDRIARAEQVRALLQHHLSSRSAAEVFETASSRGFLSGFVQGVDELLDCPQLEARSVYRTLGARAPVGRQWQVPAAVAVMSGSPLPEHQPAPRLGEHNGHRPVRPEAPAVAPPRGSDQRPGPLSGLRVVDLSTVFAVPYLSALLADFGAEVIKVESPVRPDQTRTDWGGYLDNDPGADPWNRGATFQVVNRGKKSVALNLATEQGRSVLHDLLGSSDIVLENFTPRVMRSWQLTFDHLAAANPRLIMLSNTGYGSTGPWSSFKAQGTTLEATMGLMGVTGYEGGAPMRAGQSTPDFYACWAGLMSLFAALISRERTGLGQHIDLAMYQLGASMLTDALIAYQGTGRVPRPIGAKDADAAISGVYRTCVDGEWLAVSVAEGHAARLHSVLIGGSETDLISLGEGDVADVESRIAVWVGERSAIHAERELQAAGVAASKVLDADDLAADPQLAARGFYERVQIRGVSPKRGLIGRPYRWQSSTTSAAISGDAPRFGEHNDYVTGQLLGLSRARRAALLESGVLADQPQTPQPSRAIDVDAATVAGTFHPATRGWT